jgi:hypothetical protein
LSKVSIFARAEVRKQAVSGARRSVFSFLRALQPTSDFLALSSCPSPRASLSFPQGCRLPYKSPQTFRPDRVVFPKKKVSKKERADGVHAEACKDAPLKLGASCSTRWLISSLANTTPPSLLPSSPCCPHRRLATNAPRLGSLKSSTVPRSLSLAQWPQPLPRSLQPLLSRLCCCGSFVKTS